MSLESKIKALLEGTNEDVGTQVTEAELAANLVEEDTDQSADVANTKIVAGKGKKLEDKKVTGEPSTDEPNNKKNHVDKNPVGVKEHIDALSLGEDLSEEFKTKAAAIMEVAIADGVSKELNRLEEEHALKLNEAVEAVREELEANVDGFLDTIVEKWVAENELALERGIKTDIVENFIDGLKTLFKESYVEIPEGKHNVLDEQAELIDELISKLDEATSKVDTLSADIVSLTKLRVMESVGETLSDVDYEKFAGLCEDVTFTSTESFEEKAKTLKESYFPKSRRASSIVEENDGPVQHVLVEGSIAKYVDALTSPLTFKR